MKINLEMAKEYSKNEKVFLNGNDKFNIVHAGKYCSGVTFIVSNDWAPSDPYSINTDFIVPVFKNGYEYTEVKNYVRGMNFDFDASDYEVAFGCYRTSKTGKPVFEVKSPTASKHVMIRCDWGGAFESTRGHYKEDLLDEEGILFFTRRSSNGGGSGYDYYVLPVGWVSKAPYRDVTSILEKFNNEDRSWHQVRDAKYRETIKEKERRDGFAEEFKKKVELLVGELQKTIPWAVIGDPFTAGNVRIKTYCPSEMSVGGTRYGHSKEFSTLPENLEKVENYVQQLSENAKVAEQWNHDISSSVPKEILSAVGGEFFAWPEDDGVYVAVYSAYTKTKKTDIASVEEAIKFFNDEYEKFLAAKRKAAEEMAEMAEKARREKEMLDAAEQGYPSNLTFPNRLGGKTGLCHTYVITQYGDYRPVDDNHLRNCNHRYHDNWLELADGMQTYNQIYPGDLVIGFSKDFTAAPLVYKCEFLPGEKGIELTEDQIDSLRDLYRGHLSKYNPEKIVLGDSELKSPEEFSDLVDSLNKKAIES